MRRRTHTENGSLDLLLDTICNTFGGVLFISMLVVILLSMSGRQVALTPPEPGAQRALAELERERTATAEGLRTLREAQAVQRDLERQIDDPELRDAVRRLREAQSARAVREAELDAARAQVARSQSEINEIARSLADTRAALERVRAELSEAERELERELAARTRSADLPRLRETSKTEVAFFLRGGRLCALRQVAPDGRLVLNTSEARVVSGPGGSQAVEPIVAAGTAVASGPQALAALERKFAAFDSGRHFVALVVWPDSFGQFGVVRDVLVRRRFEYRLMPWPDDEPIGLSGVTGPVLVQ